MTKTILITGATDGIGFETAKRLAAEGHNVLIHGRKEQKLADTRATLSALGGTGTVETYRADLSSLSEVEHLAREVADRHTALDVLINNAGVFKLPGQPAGGLDQRIIVNAVAPYLLTKRLLPLFSATGRIVNLSSAAQMPVTEGALDGHARMNDNEAYAQSKLALTMWSVDLAKRLGQRGPAIIAVNPASFLASKMVKDAYGVAGNDLGIGADILVRAALRDEFANASGRYFDNDRGEFASPHPDALNDAKNAMITEAMESIISSSS
ncbi:MAG: SDR family NAD(P)-dependent oxidoreductase [Pseudomonadota bacterium]